MFTKGKWVVGESGETGDYGIPCVDARLENGNLVELCTVWGTGYVNAVNDEARANARLFAASKEMYLTLKDALPGMCYLLELNGDPDAAERWDPWIEQARTLIREVEEADDETWHPN